MFLSSLYLAYCLACGDFQGYLLLLILKRVICEVILFPGYCQNRPCRVSVVEDTEPVVGGLNMTGVGRIPPREGAEIIYQPVPTGAAFTTLSYLQYPFLLIPLSANKYHCFRSEQRLQDRGSLPIRYVPCWTSGVPLLLSASLSQEVRAP